MKKNIYRSFFLFVLLGVYAFTFSTVQAYSLSLKADGVSTSVNLPFGSSPTLTWTSTDMSSCTATQTGIPELSGWNGGISTSGSVKIPHLTNNVYFKLICQNSGATMTFTDSVQIYLNFPVKPSLYDIKSKEIGGKIIPGKTAYLTGNGFLPTDNTINIGNLISAPLSSSTASSIDEKNLAFTVPDLNPGNYSIWLLNWNGMSEFLPIVISSTSTPITVPAQTATTPTQIQKTTAIKATIPCSSISYNLKYKTRDTKANKGISTLQIFLQKNGDLDSEPTGYFGGGTFAAVKKFQQKNNLEATGYVGPMTRSKITQLSCQ